MHSKLRSLPLALIACLILSACSLPGPANLTGTATLSNPANLSAAETPAATPFQPQAATPTTPAPNLSVWLDPALPSGFVASLALPAQVERADQSASAGFQIQVTAGGDSDLQPLAATEWIYALVAPFATVPDGVSSEELIQSWQGGASEPFAGSPILLDAATLATLEVVLGPAGDGAVKVVPTADLLAEAWSTHPSWAIVPFDTLDPQWKVLAIDGSSPISNQFDPSGYPLRARIGVYGAQEQMQAFSALWGADAGASVLPASNRDPSKLTVLMMTGVTALVRATAHKMDTLGVNYPGRDIRDILRAADITHISNEVSFAPDCPPGDPATNSLRFCSDSDYIGLLEDVGADVIELTGNHMNDWGTAAMAYSLDWYRQHDLQVFAGGMNLDEARQALLVEHNGNRLAFIGCNPPGPSFVWATEALPGAAPCDYDWMHAEIQRLTEQGILTIATFQYAEAYDHVPVPQQQRDFKGMAEAGAVIVSGSQAHYPQAMEFSGDAFIHYGLGNLFFDQQNFIDGNTGQLVPGTRWEFADRHVFYDGRYISTELLTFMLEDWSKPRPMTPEERTDLLERIYAASGWFR